MEVCRHCKPQRRLIAGWHSPLMIAAPSHCDIAALPQVIALAFSCWENHGQPRPHALRRTPPSQRAPSSGFISSAHEPHHSLAIEMPIISSDPAS